MEANSEAKQLEFKSGATAGGQGVVERCPDLQMSAAWVGERFLSDFCLHKLLLHAQPCRNELDAVVALNTNSTGYFNGHIALN